jgi:hypothetical protein
MNLMKISYPQVDTLQIFKEKFIITLNTDAVGR